MVQKVSAKPSEKKKTEASQATSSRKRKQTLNQHRRQRKKQAEEREKIEKEGQLVVDNYFEIETIIDERRKNGKIEYLVRWKGAQDDCTWEPPSNLCDSAFQDARKFSREKETRRKLNVAAERELGLREPLVSKVLEVELTEKGEEAFRYLEERAAVRKKLAEEKAEKERLEMDMLNQCQLLRDDEKVVFKEVERIHVDEPDAKTRVTDARIHGIPIVLTGHRGWPKFAARWIKPIEEQQSQEEASTEQTKENAPLEQTKEELPQESLIEKAKDTPSSGESIQKTEDFGWSKLAARGLSPLKDQPPQDEASAEQTLFQKTEEGAPQEKSTQKTKENLQQEHLIDLTQPHEVDIERMIEEIGEETVPILQKNYDELNPISKLIYASAFLKKCWPSNGEPSVTKSIYLHQWQFPTSETAAKKFCGKDKCVPLPNNIFNEDILQHWLDRKDNPFQYIFMGDTDTMSRLHKDNGGLEITIAPLVGEKECVLAHRSDGESCLYNLDSKLDALNLNKFPMTAFSRVWKTVIRPGEILVMPSGTYHQCRNVSPCLSYHRFHLDTVNLRPFLESMLAGDAPELEHDDVIWNCATEMTDRVDKYTTKVRKELELKMETPVPEEITKTVETLGYLRLVCREIANRLERYRYRKKPSRIPFFMKQSEDDATSHYWPRMVQDIDHTLFDFFYRDSKDPPKFRVKRGKALGEHVKEDENEEDISKSVAELEEAKSKEKEQKQGVKDNFWFVKVFETLPKLQPFQEDLVIPDSVRLEAGDEVFTRIAGRKVTGSIVKVTDQMRAMYVTYEDLPPSFDEFQPVECVRNEKESKLGEASASIVAEEAVFCSVGGFGEVCFRQEKNALNQRQSFIELTPFILFRMVCFVCPGTTCIRPVHQMCNFLFSKTSH